MYTRSTLTMTIIRAQKLKMALLKPLTRGGPNIRETGIAREMFGNNARTVELYVQAEADIS